MVVKFDQADYYATYLLEYEFVPDVRPATAATSSRTVTSRGGRSRTTGGRKRRAAPASSANADSTDDVELLN
jgi:hypothetical protein